MVCVSFQFLDGIDEEEMHFRVPMSLTLRDDGGNAVVQVWGLACRIACVSHLADDRLCGDDSTDMGVNLTHVCVVVKTQF